MMIAEIIVPLLLLAVILYVGLEYSLFIPSPRGLRILMYHKIAESGPDGLTVTRDQFDLHLLYLKENGYQPLTFREVKALHDAGKPLPRRTVIITFDDAYCSFRDLALPLLKKYGFTATLFVPVAYMGKTNIWDRGTDPLLGADALKSIALNENVEIGLHSFLHRSYGEMTVEDMEADLANCYSTMNSHVIPFVKVLAYPYGGYPKKDAKLKTEMTALFTRMDLMYALRIGNRVNGWPLMQPYELKRIDIKGSDTLFVFKTKLKKGRAKLFA
jgi:peptidoglycan/xylan/chitin deacetylase (PgdA/CDA1 family)